MAYKLVFNNTVLIILLIQEEENLSLNLLVTNSTTFIPTIVTATTASWSTMNTEMTMSSSTTYTALTILTRVMDVRMTFQMVSYKTIKLHQPTITINF